MAADDIALPFDNVCLAPLFYSVMKLDTTDEDPKNEDNRRLLADIVLFCIHILHPDRNPPELNIAADDFDGYLLNLALSGLPFDGLRYGRSLFPDYPSDAMPSLMP